MKIIIKVAEDKKFDSITPDQALQAANAAITYVNQANDWCNGTVISFGNGSLKASINRLPKTTGYSIQVWKYSKD